jgi:hypothetical protein
VGAACERRLLCAELPLLAIECRSYADLLAAVRERMAELQLSHLSVDELSGVQVGYSSKIIGPRPSRTFGPVSFSIFGALALRVTVEVDEEQAERMRHRWVPKETGSPHLVRHAGRGRAAPGEAQDSISAVAAI